MDAKTKLLRFCYLGNFQPVYRKPRTGVQVKTMLEPITELLRSMDVLEYGCTVGKLLRDYELPRKDEAIFTIAVYLATAEKIECKTNVRNAFTNMVESAEDLFLFCKYSRLIHEEANRTGFSRTTKKAIIAWYKSHTPEELREMWLQHRGLHGFTHKRLIKLCHIKDEVLGDTVITGAFFKKCSELMRNPIYNTVPEILCMSTLRTTDRNNEALKIIKKLRLKFDQVPPKMLVIPHIVEAILPQMTVLEIIKKWHVFCKLGHMERAKFFKALATMTDKSAQIKAKIHPIVYLLRMDKLGIPLEDPPKVPKKKFEAMRMEYFQKLFIDSFIFARPAGLRTLITMTVQQSYKKKFLTKNKTITYFQAATALAYSYFKREKNADVFIFTEDKVKLRQVELEKRRCFDVAMETLDKLHFTKTSQRLVQPLFHALASETVYDLILIIVPTAGRSNPGQKSEFLCQFLDRYRTVKNKGAKLVIVSLLKNKQSMTYSTERNENILEICGLDEQTINIIDSFALNRFG